MREVVKQFPSASPIFFQWTSRSPAFLKTLPHIARQEKSHLRQIPIGGISEIPIESAAVDRACPHGQR
jgi:hypothetical protein